MATDFSQGSVSKNIMSQAFPLILAQVVQMLYNVVDRIYIGHFPGTDGLALTGIGLVFPLTSLIMAFTQLLGMGGTPLFSMARGAGQQERVKQIMGNTLSMLLRCSAASPPLWRWGVPNRRSSSLCCARQSLWRP